MPPGRSQLVARFGGDPARDPHTSEPKDSSLEQPLGADAEITLWLSGCRLAMGPDNVDRCRVPSGSSRTRTRPISI